METAPLLSVVIPVYNGERFIGTMIDVFRAQKTQNFELIFVDDGSAPPLQVDAPGCRVIRVEVNTGKGEAVRRGALEAKGEWVLMSDVDMSAPFTEFAHLAARADAWMVCGSRHGRCGMPLRRRLLSSLFHFFVWCIGVRGVHDTQCGFKLFRMDVMRVVFERQRIARFAFDVELIRRTVLAGGDVAEVPVEWKGGTRSSLRVLRDAPRMLWDLLRIAVGR